MTLPDKKTLALGTPRREKPMKENILWRNAKSSR